MREFVYGTDEQYNMLKDMLNDNLCHVYYNCAFPACCSVPTGRIGFEKEGKTYAMFVDRGMACSHSNAPDLFRELLSTGTLRFLDFTDMKEFIKSLKCLY